MSAQDRVCRRSPAPYDGAIRRRHVCEIPGRRFPPCSLEILNLSSTAQPGPKNALAWQSLAPGLFVLLWASGFVVGKLGLPYARPFTILLLRFAIATVFMVAVSLLTRANWPKTRIQAFHVAVVGVLLQAVYLGGCYVAMAEGIPAGVTALIVGLQPLLTATLVGPLLTERVSPRQWLGLAIGFAGVTLVLWNKLHFDSLHLGGILYAFGGLLGITAATIYQKRFCGAVDLRTSAAIQYGAATFVLLPVAWARCNGPEHSSSPLPGWFWCSPPGRSCCCSGSFARVWRPKWRACFISRRRWQPSAGTSPSAKPWPCPHWPAWPWRQSALPWSIADDQAATPFRQVVCWC